MEDELYREIILEHWQHPQNYGVIQHADIDVQVSNPLCGDVIRLTIFLKDERVKDILFTGEGCAISKASASLFTEIVKHKSISELRKLKEQDVLDNLLVQLTPVRMKCALLIFKALKKVPQFAV